MMKAIKMTAMAVVVGGLVMFTLPGCKATCCGKDGKCCKTSSIDHNHNHAIAKKDDDHK